MTVTTLMADAPMRDGVHLKTEVWVRDDGKRHPALLYRTPYGRDGTRAAYGPGIWAERGWAVVMQDCRGRFESEGTFDAIWQEGPDGFDTVQWCAEQPWCDGRVIISGQSYIGLTSWMAALERPPALRGMVSRISSSDFGRDVVWEGGALQSFGVTWSLGMVMNDTRATPRQRAQAQELQGDLKQEMLKPWARSPVPKAAPMLRRWLDEPDLFDGLGTAKRRRWAKAPGYAVAGWYDFLIEGGLSTYVGQVRHSQQRLVIGPWVHGGEFQRVVGELDFGPAAHGKWVAPEWTRWMDAALVDEAFGGVRAFVMGANRWVDLEQWPPPAEDLTLFLHPDGALLPERPKAAKLDLHYDPADPVPSLGGRSGGVAGASGPFDQQKIEGRDDVLVFTGERLREATTVMGAITADITVSSSAPSCDLAVKVTDVWPDGRSMNLVDSLRRVDVEPGKPTRVRLHLGSTAHRFRRGHRVRVDVAASTFPRLDLNPSTGEPPGQARRLHPADHVIHLGRSSVTLPVHSSI